jgi:hypothetical protein
MRTVYNTGKVEIGKQFIDYKQHKITPEEELIQSLLIGDFKTIQGYLYNLVLCILYLIAIVTLIVNMTYWC